MMNKMMNSMIRSMTVEQKQKLMLKMMPEMMKKSDPQILIPNMLKETGRIISVFGIYELFKKLTNDNEFKNHFKLSVKKVKDRFITNMPTIFSMMTPIAKIIMPKAMSFFKPMMPGMMTIMKDESLVEEIPPDVKEEIANCMSNVMPVWLNSLHPLIETDKKEKFNQEIALIVSSEN